MTTPELVALLDVQDLDTDIDQHRHRRARLPERTALADAVARQAELARSRLALVATRDEVAGRQATLESDLAAAEARVKELNRRMYSGEVSASRELQFMATEVKALEGRASELEDRILEILDEREPLDAGIAVLDEETASLQGRQAELTVELAAAETVVDGELDVLVTARAAAVIPVGTELLATYEQLRSRLGGVGAARVVGARCGGCHLTLPATELDRIRHPRGEHVVTCEQCGRILVLVS